jgi:hypothetical protein
MGNGFPAGLPEVAPTVPKVNGTLTWETVFPLPVSPQTSHRHTKNTHRLSSITGIESHGRPERKSLPEVAPTDTWRIRTRCQHAEVSATYRQIRANILFARSLGCRNKVFSSSSHEVFWYDSKPKTIVREEALVQISSLLRRDTE